MTVDASDALFVTFAVIIIGGIALAAYQLYGSRFRKDGTIEAPLVKQQSAIHHDSYGWLRWNGFEPYAANNSYGMIKAVTETGNPCEFLAHEEEIVPQNNITNGVGERAYYYFRPNLSRMAAMQQHQASVSAHVATAIQHKEMAIEARANAKRAEANKKQEVTEMTDELAKMQKSSQQQTGGKR